MEGDPMDTVADRRIRIGDAVGMEAAVDRLPRLAVVVAPKSAGRRDGGEEPLWILRILDDRVQAHATGARRPVGRRLVLAQAGELLPALAAIGCAEEGGILDAGVDRVRIIEGRFEVPNPLELERPRRAVIPLVGARLALVDELVPNRLPGLAAVVRTLDQLSEPAGRLRCIQPVRVDWRPLDVVHLPAAKVGPVDLPTLALAI